jgi:ubiquinone/menaquinone biosynthesis C-methylase UbiE
MEKNEKRLNLGSGKVLLKGFINVDIGYDFPDKNFVKADVRELPFKDNYADYILARQVLEHITFLNVPNTLNEWFRVLKPGGRMIITCPNFNLMAKDWLETEFDINSFYEMTQGLYGHQLTDFEIHRSPITPELLKFYLGQLPLEGTIKSYPRGSKVVKYPGYNPPKNHVYRYGEVHCDLIKGKSS